MLVLSRTPMQKIQIGENITITVLRIRGNQIKLGIEAPRDVRVVRAELPPRDLTVSEAVEVPAAHATADCDGEGAGECGDGLGGPTAGSSVERDVERSAPPQRLRTAGAERVQPAFAPVTSPRWSSVPRTPGTSPLWTRVATRC